MYDFQQFMPSDQKIKLYEEIERRVFRDLDSSAVVKVNQMRDENIISLKTSSETISDIPYELGVFNTQTLNDETYSDKIKKIALALNDSASIPAEDREKLKNALSVMALVAKGADQRSSSVHQIIQ